MENQIYRINLKDRVDLEFFIIGTNECNPYKNTVEMAAQIIIKDTQLDGGLNLEELNSFIKYLTDCRDYIFKYNESALPYELE